MFFGGHGVVKKACVIASKILSALQLQSESLFWEEVPSCPVSGGEEK